jgi:hypothetical protein
MFPSTHVCTIPGAFSYILKSCSKLPTILPPLSQLCQNGGLSFLSSTGGREKSQGGQVRQVGHVGNDKVFLVKNLVVKNGVLL